jgi:tyrosyl-tRNA synthetase
MNFVEELQWRGMIHTMMPGTEEQLKKEMTTAYVGIDPTADSYISDTWLACDDA